MPWRVQATWVVDGQVRSYAPHVEDDERAAHDTAAQLRETLQHFPTLRVLVDPVDDAEASRLRAGEAARSAATPEADVLAHVVAGPPAGRTLCGLDADDVTAWIAQELLDVAADTARRLCPRCAAART